MRQYEQPDESNSQSKPPRSYTWFNAVLLLFKSPGGAAFTVILKDRAWTPQRAYFHVLVGGIFLGVALASTFSPGEMINAMLFALPGSTGEMSTPPDVLTIALSGSLLGAMYGVIGFIIQTFIFHRLGKLLGLKVSYRDLAILRAIFYPLIMTARALIIAIPAIPSVAANVLLIATLGIDVVLSAIAIRAAAIQTDSSTN